MSDETIEPAADVATSRMSGRIDEGPRFLIQPEGEFPAFIRAPWRPLQQHIRPAHYADIADRRVYGSRPIIAGAAGCRSGK